MIWKKGRRQGEGQRKGGEKEGEVRDEGNRWEEIRCPGWEGGRLESRGVETGTRGRLEGRESQMGRVMSSERKRGEGDVWRKCTYPDPVLYWGHGKLRSTIPVEPTNTT